MIFSDGSQILPSHIEETGDDADRDDGPAPLGFRQSRRRAIETFERRYVENLIRDSGGNVSRAARLVGTDRRAFGRLVKRYAIRRD